MIVISIRVKVKPDERRGFLSAVKQEMPVSRQFAGLVNYVWTEDIHEPNNFSLYEEWETRESFEVYRNSPHFQKMSAALFPLFAEHPETSYYEAALLENA